MRVLLTGIGGFIGTHCLEYYLDNTDWFIIGLDSWRHKGDYRRIEDVISPEKLKKHKDRFVLYKHDLSVPITPQLINLIGEKQINQHGIVVEKPINMIINMASDSAVERSNTDPTFCLRNNFEIIVNMLEYARICKPKIFFQVSTDEVYGQAEPGQFHKEWDKIVPSNAYAASKAAQEAVAISYWRAFNVPVVLTNSINNFGEGQDPEKFIPKIISSIISGKTMPIYGDSVDSIGKRFYLHAKNHADVFLFLSKFAPTMYDGGQNQLPDRYNIGSNVELSNLAIAEYVANCLDKELQWKLVPSEIARKGYDKRYALDSSKLSSLGWKPPIDFEFSLRNVIDWTLKYRNWSIS